MEANNVLLLPAKGVCRYETPRSTYLDRLRVKGDRICNIRHADNYEPLWSLPLAASAPAFIRSACGGEPHLRAVTDDHGKRHRDYSIMAPPSDFCGQQMVERAETVIQPERAAFKHAHIFWAH